MVEQTKLPDLDKMVRAKLFGDSGSWPATASEIEDLHRLFQKKLGPREEVTGIRPGTISTSLGNDMNLEILMVFLGLLDPCDAPVILSKYELIEDFECDRLYVLLENGAEYSVFLPLLRRAYEQGIVRGLMKWRWIH